MIERNSTPPVCRSHAIVLVVLATFVMLVGSSCGDPGAETLPNSESRQSTDSSPTSTQRAEEEGLEGVEISEIQWKDHKVTFPWATGTESAEYSNIEVGEFDIREVVTAKCMSLAGFDYIPDIQPDPSTGVKGVGDAGPANMAVYESLNDAQQKEYSLALAGVDDVYSETAAVGEAPSTGCLNTARELYPGFVVRAPELAQAATAVYTDDDRCAAEAQRTADEQVLAGSSGPISAEPCPDPAAQIAAELAAFAEAHKSEIESARLILEQDFRAVATYLEKT